MPSHRKIKASVEAMARGVFGKSENSGIPPDALLLGDNPRTAGRAYVCASDLDTHLHVVGGSRRGKTNALRKLFRQLIKRRKETGEGISLIDPHGGLAQYALEVCARDPDLADDVLYLSLKDARHVLSVNPLRAAGKDPYFLAACVREALIKVFDHARSQDLKLVSRVLTNLAEALIELRLTLLESSHFLNRSEQDEAILAAKIAQLKPGKVRRYWEGFARKPERDADVHAMGPANRLDDLTRPAVLQRIIGQSTVSVDFVELMDRGGIAIFDTSLGKNTEITTDGQALFNALLVQSYRQAFPRRTEKGDSGYDPKTTPPHTLILDEFGSYLSTEFARSLTEASKFGLRLVFAHQNLAQLVPESQDKTLLNAVLAVPNKIVFGNLPLEEAELLAKHIYLADLNPDEIKYQGETVTWDPVLHWGVTSVSHQPGSRTVSTDSASSRDRSSGSSVDPETGRRTEQESSSESDSERHGESVTTPDGPAVTEGYYVDHKMRKQPQPPIFRSVEEQVFLAARALHTNARGVAVVGTENRKPGLCRFPKLDKRLVTEEERERFLDAVVRKPCYLAGDEADRLIAERQRKLIEEAGPKIEGSSGPKKRRRVPRKTSDRDF